MLNFKKLLAILLAAVMMATLLPVSVFADPFNENDYAAYVVPYDGEDRPTSGTFTLWPGGWGLNNQVPTDSNGKTFEYEGVKQEVNGEIRYYYKTIAMAINAAKAGELNTGYYNASSNKNGVFVEGAGGEDYTKNDTLSEHIGKYTDKVVLLKDTVDGNLSERSFHLNNNDITGNESLFNFGLYNFTNGDNDREHTPYDTGKGKYGINKGIFIDMNGHNASRLSAGEIPDGQILVITDSKGTATFGTGGDAADDEGGSGYCTGTVVLSNVTMNGALWASNHHYILLNGFYNTTNINKESANGHADAGEYELRGGYYTYNPAPDDPTENKFDIQLDKTHVEYYSNKSDESSEWADTNYTYRVLKGPVQFDVVLNKNTDASVKKNGNEYNGETIKATFGETISLPPLTRDGYEHIGWSRDISAKVAEFDITANGLSTNKHKDIITLYAVWWKKDSIPTEKAASISGDNPGGVYDESADVTYYPTLTSALFFAKNGDEVKMLRDIDESIIIPSDMTITIDLNSNVLKGDSTSARTITVNGKLNVKDSGTDELNYFVYNSNGAWTYIGTPNESQKQNAVALANIENAELSSGSTVIAVPGGAISGKGVNVNGSLITNDINFVGNNRNNDNIPGDGGSVTVSNGTCTMNGGTIVGNYTNKYGGGVSVANTGVFNATDVKIDYNYAYEQGGGISANGEFNLSGGTVSHNTARADGGAIHTWSDSYLVSSTIKGTVISGNKAATGDGGGVHHTSWYYIGHTLTIIDSIITGNLSSGNGGGIYVNCPLTLGGSTVIKDNKKGNNVQNVYLPDGKTLMIGQGSNAPTTMNVGVTLSTGEGHVTDYINNVAMNTKYFTSDNSQYKVFGRDDTVYIGTVESDTLMAHQDKIIDNVPQNSGRAIICLTSDELNEITANKVTIVGGDNGNDFTITLDCAYTYFYDINGNKYEAGKSEGLKDIAAFLIIDNDGKGNPISGWGYFRVYNGEESDSNLIVHALYEKPSN